MTLLHQDTLDMDVPVRRESVLMGRDPEALDILIDLHALEAPRILDCTFNRGVMWKGARSQPDVTMDINPETPARVTGDFRAMPFADGEFGVVVFDPPHLPVAISSENSSGIWREQYGLTSDAARGRDADDVSGQFAPFLAEAHRVLADNGIVVCKLVDMVHNHRYQWQLVDFINAVRASGLMPCDLLIKRDPCGGNLKSSKWKNVRHLKRVHAYFIVARKGRCEAPRAA